MDERYLAYITLLRDLSGNLEQLSELAQQKSEQVRQNDLLGLDEVLKQEQVMTLALRGLEQKRLKLVAQLGLDGVSLSGFPARCPEHLQDRAAQTVERLRQSYHVYRSYADAARSTLELNLHEIEKYIARSGADPKLVSAGYEAPGVEPPKNMKTDFRA